MRLRWIFLLSCWSALKAFGMEGPCPIPSDTDHYVENRSSMNDLTFEIYYKLLTPLDHNKDTLLIINGGPGGDHSVIEAYTSLSTKFNLVSFDHRGLGCSKIKDRYDGEYLPKMYSIQESASDIDAIRRDLLGDDGKWFVYGMSYGGMLAQMYAFHYQEHIKGLILDSTFHRSGAIQVGREQFEDLFLTEDLKTQIDQFKVRFPEYHPRLMMALFYMSYEFAGRTRLMPQLLNKFGRDDITVDQIDDELPSLPKLEPAWGMQYSVACEEIWDYPEASEADEFYFTDFVMNCPVFKPYSVPMAWQENLKHLTIPVLMLAGGYDPVTPAKVMREMRELVPQAFYYENEFSGHVVFMEQEKCARTLIETFAHGMTQDGLEKIVASDDCIQPPVISEEKIESSVINLKNRIQKRWPW